MLSRAAASRCIRNVIGGLIQRNSKTVRKMMATPVTANPNDQRSTQRNLLRGLRLKMRNGFFMGAVSPNRRQRSSLGLRDQTAQPHMLLGLNACWRIAERMRQTIQHLFGHNLHEIGQGKIPVPQHFLRQRAVGFAGMCGHQGLQLLGVMR
jgi:hypothetical protein